MGPCTNGKQVREPLARLRDVLERIGAHAASRTEELLPDRWRALRPAVHVGKA